MASINKPISNLRIQDYCTNRRTGALARESRLCVG
jgi:hypothetical protein